MDALKFAVNLFGWSSMVVYGTIPVVAGAVFIYGLVRGRLPTFLAFAIVGTILAALGASCGLAIVGL